MYRDLYKFLPDPQSPLLFGPDLLRVVLTPEEESIVVPGAVSPPTIWQEWLGTTAPLLVMEQFLDSDK